MQNVLVAMRVQIIMDAPSRLECRLEPVLVDLSAE